LNRDEIGKRSPGGEGGGHFLESPCSYVNLLNPEVCELCEGELRKGREDSITRG